MHLHWPLKLMWALHENCRVWLSATVVPHDWNCSEAQYFGDAQRECIPSQDLEPLLYRHASNSVRLHRGLADYDTRADTFTAIKSLVTQALPLGWILATERDARCAVRSLKLCADISRHICRCVMLSFLQQYLCKDGNISRHGDVLAPPVIARHKSARRLNTSSQRRDPQ